MFLVFAQLYLYPVRHFSSRYIMFTKLSPLQCSFHDQMCAPDRELGRNFMDCLLTLIKIFIVNVAL